MHILGIDIGGTKTRLGVVQYNNVIEAVEFPTPQLSGGPFFQMLKSEAVKLKNFDKIKAVGIGFAGTISNDEVVAAQHLPHLNNAPLKNLATLAFGHPVTVINDVQAAAVAEWNLLKKPKSLWAVFPGTGLGSALIIDGKLWPGSMGTAGEIGYFITKGESLEKNIISKYIQEKTGLTLPEIKQRSEAEGKELINFWHGYGRHLGWALSYGLLLVNPEYLVLGGGVSWAGYKYFKKGLEEIWREELPRWAWPKNVEYSRGGENSVLLGAAELGSRF